MNITLSVETYKGVDGSSLSSTRCDQIVQVYEMLELFGSKSLTYIDIQEEAQKRKLFGETNAKSAIRTFFPLLLITIMSLMQIDVLQNWEHNLFWHAEHCITFRKIPPIEMK